MSFATLVLGSGGCKKWLVKSQKLWLDAVALEPLCVWQLGRYGHRQPFSLTALFKHVAVATRLILRNSIDVTKSRR